MLTAVFQEMRQASATLLWPELLTSPREIARCDAYVGYQSRAQCNVCKKLKAVFLDVFLDAIAV